MARPEQYGHQGRSPERQNGLGYASERLKRTARFYQHLIRMSKDDHGDYEDREGRGGEGSEDEDSDDE